MVNSMGDLIKRFKEQPADESGQKSMEDVLDVIMKKRTYVRQKCQAVEIYMKKSQERNWRKVFGGGPKHWDPKEMSRQVGMIQRRVNSIFKYLIHFLRNRVERLSNADGIASVNIG